MSHYDMAVKLDKHYSAAAYVGKAYILLKRKK